MRPANSDGAGIVAGGSASIGPSPEPLPAGIERVFGSRTPQAKTYVESLATEAVRRGLIGPREPGRIWTRHVLNCAAVQMLLPPTARVVDIGSGAGLPGIVIALARPDVSVDLVESLERRVTYLNELVGMLGLTEQVRVLHGRAEEPRVRSSVGDATCVTARAVASLPRLLAWCAGLLGPAGTVALIKGATAPSEVAAARDSAERAGWRELSVLECQVTGVEPPPAPVLVVTATWSGPRATRVRTRRTR